MTGRATMALAERLGTTPVVFPGGHGGFLPAEWGPGRQSDAFATKLREVLAARGAAVGARPVIDRPGAVSEAMNESPLARERKPMLTEPRPASATGSMLGDVRRVAALAGIAEDAPRSGVGPSPTGEARAPDP